MLTQEQSEELLTLIYGCIDQVAEEDNPFIPGICKEVIYIKLDDLEILTQTEVPVDLNLMDLVQKIGEQNGN